MKWLESLIYFLFPTLRLHATPWHDLWQHKDRARAVRLSRIYLVVIAVIYVVHYLLIESRNPVAFRPWQFWATYRLGGAALSVALFFLTYLAPFRSGGLVRLPYLLMAFVASNLQAASMVWYPAIPYAYGVIIAIIATSTLQTTQFKTIIAFCVLYGAQVPWYIAAHVPPFFLPSGALLAICLLMILRAGSALEISAFISEQESLEAHKKLIESEIELNSEIRSFLPSAIYDRVVWRIRNRQMSVLQAMDEELRARETTVACIFSDIRGYTQKSKDMHGYLYQSALPNIRLCTETVEAHRGIPHLVGDLVFSYFDLESERSCILSALSCAAALVEVNNRWNQKIDESNQVSRFVLVSFGKAIVGNIGGAASSREITAMGPAVNILSRIDPLTKDPALRHQLDPSNIILTRDAAEAATRHVTGLNLHHIDLEKLSLAIRDFPEETGIWILSLEQWKLKHVREPSAVKSDWEEKNVFFGATAYLAD